MKRSVTVAGREIGPGEPAWLVAELSGNHNGDVQRAVDTIHAASEAGADAVKLQTYTKDTLTISSERPEFVVPGEGPWSGRTLYDLYEEAHTPWDWHERLFDTARSVGLTVFSTPFDRAAVELLEGLNSPAHKIASFELVDDELLRLVGASGKPVILSTGMATLEEISHAIGVLRSVGAEDLVLLRCTSSYPAPDHDMDLASITALSTVTGLPVGLSDHSMGVVAPVVAVTLGACMIEKHLTLSRADGGVDSHFSLEPEEFADMVKAVRRAEEMMGHAELRSREAEAGSVVFRRSLFAVRDIAGGELLSRDNVRAIRPGHGLPPRELSAVIGRRASQMIPRGTPLSWEILHPT